MLLFNNVLFYFGKQNPDNILLHCLAEDHPFAIWYPKQTVGCI